MRSGPTWKAAGPGQMMTVITPLMTTMMSSSPKARQNSAGPTRAAAVAQVSSTSSAR